MKTLTKYLFLIVAFICFTNISQAQKHYQSFDYMKVEAGNHQDYLAMEKVWKKIHTYNIKRGKISGWELLQVMSPTGSQTEYNYVTRISLKEGKQFEEFMTSFPMPENLDEMLTPEEMKLFKRTGELRTYVKNEVYSSLERILPEGYQDAKIHVFNYFDHPEGKRRADHVKVEKEHWMPMHKARIEADLMEGWVMGGMMFPFGADQPYHEITVDMYSDMTQYMKDYDFEEIFKEVHPDKSIEQLMKDTRSYSILRKGEIRMVLDRVTTSSVTTANN